MANRTKRQTRLTFTPLPSSSPAASGYNKQIQDRAASIRYESPFKRRRVESPSPSKMVSKDRLPLTPDPTARSPQDVESDGSNVVRTSRRSSRKESKQKLLDFSNSMPKIQESSSPVNRYGTSSDDEVVITKATKRGKDGNGFLSSASKRLTRQSKKAQDTSPLSHTDVDGLTITPSKAEKAALPTSGDDEDDEDEMPTAMGTQRRGQRSRKVKDDFIASSESEEAESDDGLPVVSTQQRNGKRKIQDDDDDELVTPQKRRLKRSKQKDRQAQADLDEDLDFLEPTSDADDTPRPVRNTQSVKKDKRLQALDALKRKRAGQKAIEVVDDNEGEEEEAESDQDSQTEDVPTSSKQFFAADEEDEDFIADDENGLLGAPDDSNIPIEFTRYATMKPKDLFKYAVEWMIHKRINPAFSASDELYNLTFKKLNDEVSGMVGSKFSSSAWTQEFTLALRARPAISVTAIDTGVFDEDLPSHCDACNRSKHPARCEIKFQGKPYDPETLDEVEQGNGSDSESDGESGNRMAYDHHGHELNPSNRVYQVGRFCTANAEAAHELHHWRLNLYEFVAEWLETEGYNEPEKVVRRDKMNTAKRRKEANKILDVMEQEGVVKKLWKEFQRVTSGARASEQGRWK